jgi:hypothetical protein
MNVVYERSGGFAGMMQSLRIEDFRTLRARDKGRVGSERELTSEEAEQLRLLLDRAEAAPPPLDDPEARMESDSYAVTLSFDEEPEPRVSLSTLTLPILGAGDVWDELLGWFDRHLTAELRGARQNPPQIGAPADPLDSEER